MAGARGPLVALSVSAALTATLDTNTKERLEWLKVVLSQMNVRDAEILDVVPHIMDVLSQRLQGAYMVLSEEQPNSPALKSMAQLNRQVGEIKRVLA